MRENPLSSSLKAEKLDRDYLISKGAQLDPSQLYPSMCVEPYGNPPKATIERPPVVPPAAPFNPYVDPFDPYTSPWDKNPVAPRGADPSDAPEGPSSLPRPIPRGWTGAPEYRRATYWDRVEVWEPPARILP
jgi:hypothetical protein